MTSALNVGVGHVDDGRGSATRAGSRTLLLPLSRGLPGAEVDGAVQ